MRYHIYTYRVYETYIYIYRLPTRTWRSAWAYKIGTDAEKGKTFISFGIQKILEAKVIKKSEPINWLQRVECEYIIFYLCMYSLGCSQSWRLDVEFWNHVTNMYTRHTNRYWKIFWKYKNMYYSTIYL